MDGIEVYKAIASVQGEMAAIGIKKDKKNQVQGYNFRGIDDVYDALAPLLSKHGLCILPRVTERVCVERQTAKGGTLFYVTVKCEFDFVAASDGSKHTIVTYGEAMDSGDKATNKAMSAAYKYAAFQTFCIPVDVPDADSTTHEVKPIEKQAEKKPEEKPAKATAEQKVTIREKMIAAGITDRKDQTSFYSYVMVKDEAESADLFIEAFEERLGYWRKANGNN